MNINIDVKNLARWLALLKEIPRKARPLALKTFGEFMLNVMKNKSYPKYNYVARKTAYGYTFKSDAQRKWFWANGGPAMIGNHRTGRLKNAWTLEGNPQGSYKLTNNAPGAGWVMGSGQARQPALVGWPKAWDLIQQNAAAGIKAAKAAVLAAFGGK